MKWPVPVQETEAVCSLVSYAMKAIDKPAAGFETLEAVREKSDLVILDSGAFSVRRRGKTVNLDRYGAFAAEAARKGLVEVVVNLDVGDTAEMRRNFASLRRRVSEWAYPLWVHQPFMGWDALVGAAKRYPYVGLGTAGMDTGSHAVMRGDAELKYYRAVHRILEDHGSAAHGFAMTAIDFLYDEQLNWLTCDSSTWVGTDRFGFGVVNDLVRRRSLQTPHPYVAIPRKTMRLNNIPTIRFDEIHRALRQYGLTVAEWSKLSKQEACTLVGCGYMAIGDDLARIRPARDEGARARLRDAGLPQLARSNATAVVLVVINEMSAGRYNGVADVRESSKELTDHAT
jgi:hypothetical protein